MLHHIAGDGWSLGPLRRDLAALYAARCAGGAGPLPALPVQYADYTLWQQAVLGGEDDAGSVLGAAAGVLAAALAGLPEQLELPADRPRPAVASHRGGQRAAAHRRRAAPRACGAGAGAGASLFMVLQAALAALLTRLGAGDRHRRSAARSPGAATRRWTSWSASSSTRWCCAPTRRATRAFGELLAGCGAATWRPIAMPELPFERLVEVLNPARSLSRHPLFQVMLAFEARGGGPSLELPGLAVAAEPVATAAPSSTCRSG